MPSKRNATRDDPTPHELLAGELLPLLTIRETRTNQARRYAEGADSPAFQNQPWPHSNSNRLISIYIRGLFSQNRGWFLFGSHWE